MILRTKIFNISFGIHRKQSYIFIQKTESSKRFYSNLILAVSKHTVTQKKVYITLVYLIIVSISAERAP